MAELELYDLFVIGGGSGGLAAAQQAAKHGAKVAVADYVVPSWQGTKWGLGGTCLNVGCIPKKLMHTAALVTDHHATSVGLGWDTKATHNWETMATNIQNYIKGQNFGNKSSLKSNKVKYFNKLALFGEKKFMDPAGGKFAIDLFDGRPEQGGTCSATVLAKNVMVATGGRPNDGGFENAHLCISSDDIFWQKKPAGKTLVIGASYIALECAGFMNGLGFDTTIMVRSVPLRLFDQDCAKRIKAFMLEHGCNFIDKKVPSKFYEKDGKIGCIAQPAAGGETEDIGLFDTVLLAIGRDGCAGWIRPENAGITLNRKGDKMIVDANDATNVPGIYAIGDVAEGRPELTPVAIQSGRMLADRLFGGKTELMDYDLVCTTIFTPLEMGTCGMSEDEAAKKDGLTIYVTLYTPLEWRLIKDTDERFKDKCMMKVIVEDATDRVVGLHILGPNAGEVLQGFGLAMKLGLTKAQLDQCVGIHPTNAEELTTLTMIKKPGEEVEAKKGC